MLYTKEEALWCFNFHGGALRNAKHLAPQELDQLEKLLPELLGLDFSVIPTETQINNLFWHDFGRVCEAIGLDPEEVMNRDEE